MSDELQRLYIVFDADGKPYIKGLSGLERQTHTSATTMEKRWASAGRTIQTALGVSIAGITASIIGIGASMVKSAASFEYEMSRVKAVSNATGTEMKALSDLALQLGKDTVFSSGEAAKGLYALSTAGVSVADILGGAGAAALSLAAAGELDVGRAAEVAAAAMNVFKLSGKDVMQVADALASGAVKSAAEVSDMADAFQMAGSVAADAGLTVQELTAMIAEMANAGIRGSDAGTSLKQMFLQLEVPSDKAAKLMDNLGISIYDTNGKMLNAEEIIRRVHDALAPLTEQEQKYAKGVIFGTDAIRAANIVIGDGVQAFDQMRDAVSKQGEADRIAKEKMDNLKGSWEQLKGSAETLAISIGTKAIPKIREYLDELTGAVNDVLDTGDWSGLGEKIGDVIAEGIRASMPVVKTAASEGAHVIVDAFGEVVAGGLDWFTGGSQFQGSSKMERWANYLQDRVADYTAATRQIQTATGTMTVANRGLMDQQAAWEQAIEDLLSKKGIHGILEQGYFGTPSGDQLMQLILGTGRTLTQEDIDRAISMGLPADKVKAAVDKQRAAVFAAMQFMTNGQDLSLDRAAEIMAGNFWEKGVIPFGNGWGRMVTVSQKSAAEIAKNEADAALAAKRLDDAIADLNKTYQSIIDPTGAYTNAVKRNVDALNARADALDKQADKTKSERRKKELKDEADALRDQARAFDDTKLSMEDWAKALEDQLKAQANFHDNVIKIAETYGKAFGPETIMKLAQQGAERLQAFIGARPDTQQRILADFKGGLTSGMEDIGGEVQAICAATGAKSQAALVDNLTDLTKWQRVTSFFAGTGGKTISQGLQSAIDSKTYTATVRVNLTGATGGDLGMSLEDYAKQHFFSPDTSGFGGMTPTAAGMWDALRGYDSNVRFLGGRAARSWASDHPSGNAFDFSDTPAEMWKDSHWLASTNPGGHLKYVIYDGQIWHPERGWGYYQPPAALVASGADAYHKHHVHVSVKDFGGMLNTGWNLVGNFTGRQEAVLTPTMGDDLRTIVQMLRPSADTAQPGRTGSEWKILAAEMRSAADRMERAIIEAEQLRLQHDRKVRPR